MPGKIFDLDEPNPNKALEVLRQTALSLRDAADSLILDSLDSQLRADEAQAVADQLIIDALNAELRAADAQAVTDQLILGALDAELADQARDARNDDQDNAIDLLILDALSRGSMLAL